MLYITGNMHGEMARFEDSRIRKLKKGDTLIEMCIRDRSMIAGTARSMGIEVVD